MGEAPKSAGGGIAKYLDVEIKKSNGFTFDFSSIEGYEKLTVKNFSVLALKMSTHGVANANVTINAYDPSTGILTLKNTGYLMCSGGTFRIIFGNIK